MIEIVSSKYCWALLCVCWDGSLGTKVQLMAQIQSTTFFFSD